jgi:chromosomal replication initiation ATPase DnaA
MSPETIIGEVACITGIPVAAITGRTRTTATVHARFLAIAAVRQAFAWWSLTDIGHAFHRDHGTITHALTRHRDLLSSDPAYQQHATELKLTSNIH